MRGWLPTSYAVRNLGRSPLRLCMSVLGAALVVGLILAAASFVNGLSGALASSGLPDNVILLGAGSEESIERSEIAPSAAGQIGASLPGIRESLGVQYISPEVHMAVKARHDDSDPESGGQIVVRGVRPEAFLVHRQVRLIDGRAPRTGADEIILGELAEARLGLPDGALAIGQQLWFEERAWTIVGRFAAPGTVMHAEVWVPLTDLQVAARRHTISCVVLTLGPDTEWADVDAFAKSRLDLELIALSEVDYYDGLIAFFKPVRTMAWVTAILVAMGGLLGGLNTMYAAFASRVREVGMLQSLGYRRRAIVASFVQESLLGALAGTLLAVVGVKLFLDGVAVRISMGAFGLHVDETVLLGGLSAGLVVGLVGALPPIWRCLKMPMTESLKAI